ncbi:hypothetical protein [Granulibacter bethesdensis]|uniref:hypothetical protein n=1 Tax=Granulibacter bethesdensis TaxID=364410 RepID=UPI0003F20AF6|nr:hypothetical protein [Granulibacter bethesdensis]AHJ65406.1 Hypothetical protein GbCGDNIH4_2115 [Granulibacter bethesdensis CGDNIH4]
MAVDEAQQTQGVGLILLSGDYARVHFGFSLAAGAAALGRKVVIFASAAACPALMRDWSALDGAGRDKDACAKGVAGLDELRDALSLFDIPMILCEAGLKMADLMPQDVLPGVRIGGIAGFLEASQGCQIVSI